MAKKPDIKTWKDIGIAGVVESGTSEYFHTGDWRSNVPVWQQKNCIQCLTCWAYCPDNAIKLKDGPKGKERAEFDYDYCKGCGICPEECPVNGKVIKALQAANPKIEATKAHGNPEFDEKGAILFVGLKEAKEKFNIK
jgi:pyruvate ferredoxin oxidoreductase delta subunit